MDIRLKEPSSVFYKMLNAVVKSKYYSVIFLHLLNGQNEGWNQLFTS